MASLQVGVASQKQKSQYLRQNRTYSNIVFLVLQPQVWGSYFVLTPELGDQRRLVRKF